MLLKVTLLNITQPTQSFIKKNIFFFTDLKNPKTNKNKTPGFHDDERQGFTDLLAEGFFDSFRELYPNARDCWSFWTYMMNARAKNVGW